MPQIGLPELIIILVVILLLFGSSKLPDLAKAMGRSIREFKKASAGEDEPKTPEKATEKASAADAPVAQAKDNGKPADTKKQS